MEMPIIITPAGTIENKRNFWFFNYTLQTEDVREIPLGDGGKVDTLIVRHNGKFGIYTLPNLSDYGNDGSLEWISLDEAPFPYDEIQVLGMNGNDWGFIAYRIGEKWGIYLVYYVFQRDCVGFSKIVPCKYSSIEEAIHQFPTWRDPFKK